MPTETNEPYPHADGTGPTADLAADNVRLRARVAALEVTFGATGGRAPAPRTTPGFLDAGATIRRIAEVAGDVCDRFGACDHPACTASYAAWAIADIFLTHAPAPSDERDATTTAGAHA